MFLPMALQCAGMVLLLKYYENVPCTETTKASEPL